MRRSDHSTGGHDLNLQRLRLVATAAPAAFLALVGALSLFALKLLIPDDALRFIVTFAFLAACTIPFAVWLFRLIQNQQQDLAQSSVLLESVTDHAIFLLDADANVRTWNPGAERVKGYRADEIIGRSFTTFYTDEDKQSRLPEQHLEEAKLMGHTQYEGWRVRKDGTQFWAVITLNAVRDELGNVVGFSKVTQDRTDRRNAEDQIRQLNQQLQSQLEALRVANQQVERRNRQLAAVNAAIGAISGTFGSDVDVLQRIVDSARDLVQARYGALGVANQRGRIVQFITSGMDSAERESIGNLPEGHGLLGALIHDVTPIRLARICDDERSSGFPPNHPPMTSLLGVPITYQGTTVGDLYMTDKLGGVDFSEDDQDMLVLLARHAAVAITNASLYQEADRARDDLKAWNAQLEHTVRDRTKEIERYSREMTARVIAAQEEERQRIARDLHDETAQSLATLLINIDVIESRQTPDPEGSLREGLERLRALARRTLDEIRALSHDLRPPILDDVGLLAALEWYAEEWSQSYAPAVKIERANFTDQRLSGQTELNLFRIAQEALSNVAKHAKAKRVQICLSTTSTAIVLSIADDGIGFDPLEKQARTRSGGLGLFGMRERAELAGGFLEIATRPEGGTIVTVTLPTPAADPPVLSIPAQQQNGASKEIVC